MKKLFSLAALFCLVGTFAQISHAEVETAESSQSAQVTCYSVDANGIQFWGRGYTLPQAQMQAINACTMGSPVGVCIISGCQPY